MTICKFINLILVLGLFRPAFSVLPVSTEDVFVPPDCVNFASPSDHLIIEYIARYEDGEKIGQSFQRPNQLFHIVLENNNELPILQGLKGMCLNGTRKLTWSSGKDLDLKPLLIYKSILTDIEDPVSVTMTLVHITTQTDYAIFEQFNLNNISGVLDLVDLHRGVNAVDEWGQTALMKAVNLNDLHVVSALLNTRFPRVNVNAAKPSGYNALFYSTQNPNVSIMKALLRKGANPNSRLVLEDSIGTTPLHIACSLEKVKHIETLLEYGADPSLLNEHGKSPIQVLPADAVRSTKLYVRRLFEEAYAKLQAAASTEHKNSPKDL